MYYCFILDFFFKLFKNIVYTILDYKISNFLKIFRVNSYFYSKIILVNLFFAICYLVFYILINLQVNSIKILIVYLILEKKSFKKY